ncbi:probable pectinesterase/pectinesterase inhibitor 20 [Camellia sinensis]|uniref:Pectinesterase n=1 Tax=Camellia sinensis var. sinensis TaxID=542762 RepID=A0A4S4DIP2_CAMSN|nr:probable pectinesterase/pectinesterase inhibitor 20 [Camellia sinensis]THG02665.1 hypothetical protein TEA_025377 [Camellia sinensis var. sinensis]
MASMHSSTCIFSLFLIFHLSLAIPSTTSSPDTVCRSTPFPSVCKSMLPGNQPGSTIHDYGRFSIRRSLATTQNLLSLINSYLSNQNTLSQTAIRALQDCQHLISLNLDFLSNASQSIGFTDTLQSSQADDTHTLLSAVLTNQQTCSDGLQVATLPSSAIQNALLTPLNNGNMMNSVSLALFKQGWAHNEARHGRGLLTQLFFGGGAGGVNVSQMVVVNQDGSGNFTNITAAVAAAPTYSSGSNGYFVIYVVAGVYQEYVTITKNQTYLMMIGDGINHTIITGNHSVADGWTTFNSATFVVEGQGFVALNLTIRNTAGPQKFQAVALRNDADLSTFYNCSFEGYQDTLYTHSLRQFYRQCDVYGTVDFIFGNAATVLQDCNLYPRLPLLGQSNTITAQGKTDINQNTGTSIHNCSITAAQDLASSNGTTQTFLGRPWKLYSTVVYMQSFMDYLINPAGWAPWSGDFALNTSYYAEYNNYGPGSNTSNRVTWLGYHVIGATDAVNFTVSNFIFGDHWLPQTKVPYIGGLM